MPKDYKIIVNEFGQKVRQYEWDEFQRRLQLRKPWKGDADLNGKVLVVRHTWGIGDVLYTTPALHELKRQFPNCTIRYICSHPDILENNPDVDHAHHWMQFDDFMEIGDVVREDWYWLDYDVPLKGGYDYKIHLRSKPQMNEFMVKLLTKKVSDLNYDERAFIDQASSSVIQRYRLVALDMYCWHAHVDPPDKTVYYYPYNHELEQARQFLAPLKKQGYKVITLMPHSSSPYKDYPHWREVVRLLPKTYFWLLLDSQVRDVDLWRGMNIYDCSAMFKLRQAIALVLEADMCCSSDTGVIYPRLAQGKPAVVTYGPHEPQPFLHYFQPQAHGLRVPKLTWTPGMEGMCSVGCYIDTQSCHKSGLPAPCLQELEPTRVAEEIRALLSK